MEEKPIDKTVERLVGRACFYFGIFITSIAIGADYPLWLAILAGIGAALLAGSILLLPPVKFFLRVILQIFCLVAIIAFIVFMLGI